jgi:cytochrome P450
MVVCEGSHSVTVGARRRCLGWRFASCECGEVAAALRRRSKALDPLDAIRNVPEARAGSLEGTNNLALDVGLEAASEFLVL